LATQFYGFRELGQFLWQSLLMWFYCHLCSSFGIFLNALSFVNLNHESRPCCCQRMWNLAHEIFKHIFGPWSLKPELWNQSIVLSFMTIFGQSGPAIVIESETCWCGFNCIFGSWSSNLRAQKPIHSSQFYDNLILPAITPCCCHRIWNPSTWKFKVHFGSWILKCESSEFNHTSQLYDNFLNHAVCAFWQHILL
jgi:hypothetical protein